MHSLRNEIYDQLGVIQVSTLSVVEGMTLLLDFCQAALPLHDYETLRALPYDADSLSLRAWLTDVLTTEPPASEIRAFFFGLYEPYLEDGAPACQMYVSGSTRYDPQDRSGEWATWNADTYNPEKRYADSPVLTQLYRLVQPRDEIQDIGFHDESHDAEFLLNLGYAMLIVKNLCCSLPPALFLGQATERAVAMGYDSGDLIPMGMITPQGFRPLPWT
jgi:hypothetical protein